jgi:dolichyl-phosphate-mannose-protein mannosyltransferase
VVQRGGQLREGKRVLPPLVLDLDVPLFDVDVGLAVLAHRPELDQMALGDVVANREEQIEVADHVRVLGLDRLLTRGHRVGSRCLLAVVDDRFGANLGDDAVEEVAVLHRSDEAADFLTRQLLPGGNAFVETANRSQRAGAGFLMPAAAREIVDDRNLVTASRKPQSRRPAQVAVAPKNENAHRSRQGTERRRHSISSMSGLAARNGGRLGLAALAAILLLGLALRVDYAWEGRAPVFDAVAYGEIARNLDKGSGFTLGERATQAASNYSPGLPLLVAGLYKLSGGEHERFARVVLALIGTLSVLFTYLIARRLANPFAGLVGAAAVAIYPALLEYQGMFMGDPLAATLLSGAVLSMLWAAGPAHERWLVPGPLLGALVLVRPEYLGISLLLAAVVVARDRSQWRAGLLSAAILLVGAAIVIAPWTVRNAIALDRFVPVSTGGGQVLFAGTYLPSDGDPEKVGVEVVERHPGLFDPQDVERLRLEQILARLAAQRYPDLPSDEALGKMGREQLWDDITQEPVEYAGFVATKVWRIWSHGPRDVMERPGWEAFHWALAVFGLVGLIVLARQRRWEALLLATVFVSITASSALLVASPRRVLVMLPLIAALAGVGATACRDSLARRWHRS